ncbi:MAG: hypothetical protein AB1510_13305 [Bacillota bacterium]
MPVALEDVQHDLLLIVAVALVFIFAIGLSEVHPIFGPIIIG